jgi:hypothetical protein
MFFVLKSSGAERLFDHPVQGEKKTARITHTHRHENDYKPAVPKSQN